MAEQTVELEPGESKVISFEAIPHEARRYQVSVNGLTGSFDAIVKQVNFTGHVTDAETGQALGDVVVEMWEGSAKLASTSTDSSGFYRIENIPVPITIVLKYSKSGYRDTVTQPIELGETGGGLDVELIPTVPTKLVLYFTNPNTGATHWNAWDLDKNAWLAEGLPKLITEGFSFIPEKNRLFMVFREARNQFFNIMEYGPYVIDIPGLGVYIWDARAARLNGVSAVNLMGTSGSIKGIAGGLSETNVEGVRRMSIRVTEATTSPGKYFVGKTIKADTTQTGSFAGVEISGYLKIQANAIGGLTMYPGFAMVISSITYPGQLPPDYYSLGGGYTRSSNDNGSFRNFAIGFYSNGGYSGIPILFKAYVSGIQHSFIQSTQEGSQNSYNMGGVGTLSVQRTLPRVWDDYSGYFLSLSNYSAIAGAQIRVYLNGKQVRTLS